MTPFSSERHIRFWAWSTLYLKMVQLAIDREIAPTGASRELDAHLFQRGADPIGANVRVFRQFFDFLDR